MQYNATRNDEMVKLRQHEEQTAKWYTVVCSFDSNPPGTQKCWAASAANRWRAAAGDGYYARWLASHGGMALDQGLDIETCRR